jgi:hypothetical protein
VTVATPTTSPEITEPDWVTSLATITVIGVDIEAGGSELLPVLAVHVPEVPDELTVSA